jgi:hypothetical protein
MNRTKSNVQIEWFKIKAEQYHGKVQKNYLERDIPKETSQ